MTRHISKRLAEAESKKETEKELMRLGVQSEKLNRDADRSRIKMDQLKRRVDNAEDFDPTLFQENYIRAENNEQRNALMNQIAAHHSTWEEVYKIQKEQIDKLRDVIVELKNDAVYMDDQASAYIVELDKADKKMAKIVTEVATIKAYVADGQKREADLRITVYNRHTLLYTQTTLNLVFGIFAVWMFF